MPVASPHPSRRTVIGTAMAVGATGGAAGASALPLLPPTSARLWYRQPAAAWTQALPVGTGRSGAMVFGGTVHERLQLNQDTLWTGGPYRPVNPAARGALAEVRRLIFAGDYAAAEALTNEKLIGTPRTQMAYQPFADLLLDLPEGAERDYRRELDLDRAIATTQFVLGGTRYRREVFADAVNDVIAVRLEADRPFDLSVALRTEQRDARVTSANDVIMLRGDNGERAGIAGALRFAVRAHVSADRGTVNPTQGGMRVSQARAVTIMIAMATSYRGPENTGGDPDALTREAIETAAAVPFARLRARAIAEHRALYRRVSFDLGRTAVADLPTDERIMRDRLTGDPALATLYFDYARYLLIASSRAGSQPANLQGIWNDKVEPPWESKYTVNINTEMNYWPAEIAALPECVEPLIRMVRELAVTGARTAREMYGARGWVCHHNTDLWRATAPIDGAQWGMWPTGGAWLCTHLWERYDYGRDLEYLRSVYPVMRGAALFFVDTLQRDPRTGELVTNPSISPENAHPRGASVCAGPAMDNQILRDLFDQVARAAAILDTDADFAAQLTSLRRQLPRDRIGHAGQLQEWREDWDMAAPEPKHRHVSHLYALFPSGQIDLDATPALAAAARRSLELRGDESTGWATAWRAALWARLREGDHAHRILAFLLGPGRTYPNLFDAHPPFQIDGNFGGARAMMEMLVQTRGDDILLLPALPTAWPRGAVRGLRLRGACELDLTWDNGAPAELTLRSRLPGTRRVRFGDRQVQVTLSPGRAVHLSGARLVPA